MIYNKIVFFIPSLAVGGAEKVFVTLANRFAEEGFDVTLLTLGINDSLRQEVSDKVTLSSLGVRRLIYSLPPLIRFLVTHKIDILISGLQPANFISTLAHLISRSTSKHYVTEHSNSSSQLQALPKPTRWVVKHAIKWSYSRAQSVVAVSQGVKDCLVESYLLPPQRIVVIHNPINLELIRLLASYPITHEWFVDRELPVAVGVGRLTPAKNFSMLLDAVVIALKTRPFRLVIIGDGELRASLEQKIEALNLSKNVAILGYKANPFPYIAAADVLAVSSSREGFSNVIAEGLALGTPVVSTDCRSGPAEILEDGKWGRLVPVDDAAALADALLRSIEEGKRVCYTRAQDFSDHNVVQHYIKAFQC